MLYSRFGAERVHGRHAPLPDLLRFAFLMAPRLLRFLRREALMPPLPPWLQASRPSSAAWAQIGEQKPQNKQKPCRSLACVPWGGPGWRPELQNFELEQVPATSPTGPRNQSPPSDPRMPLRSLSGAGALAPAHRDPPGLELRSPRPMRKNGSGFWVREGFSRRGGKWGGLWRGMGRIGVCWG